MLAGAMLVGAVLGTSVEPPKRADGAVITTDADGGAAVEFVVSPRQPVIAAADDEVQFGLLIRNTTASELPAGTVTLELDTERLNDPDDLDEELPDSAVRFVETEIGSTAPGADQTASVTVPRSDLPIGPNAAAGAYRVGATLEFADAPEPGFAVFGSEPGDEAAVISSVSTETSIVWKGAGTQTVPVSVIVPFVLPPEIRTLPTRGQLEDLAPGWDRLLTAARAHDATLAIDPRVIAGIRAYGDEAPRNARLLLSRLETTPLPSFLLQFADADPSAQAALGFTTLLEPTSLDFVSRFGSFSEVPEAGDATGADEGAASAGNDETAEPGADAEPDAEPEPEAAPLPTLNDLLDWPQQETLHAWPAEGRADPALLPLLESEGIDSLVLSSDGVELDGGPRGRIGETAVTVTDAKLDRAARTALQASTETERSGGVARLAADLVLDAPEGAGGVVLALDRGATGGAPDPAALLEQIGNFGWASPTPIAEQTAGSVELRPSGPLQGRLELLRSASNREGSVNEVGAVLARPEYLSGYQRTRLLELFSTRYAGEVGGFADVAAAFRERDAELLSGVQAISTEHIQLVGSSSRVPVQLRNALPFDAVVTVDVQPASAALSLEERRFEDVLVPAETTERVLVPVRSRVSSGESGLVVSVSASDEQTTVFTGTLSITIRSSIETIIFGSLGGLTLLLLVFGIVRSVRRNRSRAAGSTNERDAPEVPVPGV